MSEALRILVVDDEDDVLTLLRYQLGSIGDLEVVGTASDGYAALEQCRKLNPDAVVMDLLMPGLNGFQAIAAMKHEMPQIGVVAYTAVAGHFVRSEMERLDVPLVLKSGDVGPLAGALRDAASSARGTAGGSGVAQ